VLALSALAAAFIEAGPQGWLGIVPTTLFALGVVFGVFFVATERRQAHSMVPLGLFKERTFSVAVGVGFAFNLSLYGALLCLSIYLQQSRGESALATGLLLLPMAVLVAAGSILSGRLTSRVGHRIPMVTGFLIAGAGACLFTTVTRHSSLALLVVGTLLLGLCSIAMPAMSSLAVSTVPPEQAGVASGVFNTARQAGGALGVAVLGSLLGAGVGAASSKSMSLAHPMIVAAVALIGGAVASFLGAREQRSQN
jgi:DHA2 family methylenomycin A resistance protein-like MFS transporter